jgi:hypothetical protein
MAKINWTKEAEDRLKLIFDYKARNLAPVISFYTAFLSTKRTSAGKNSFSVRKCTNVNPQRPFSNCSVTNYFPCKISIQRMASDSLTLPR